VSSIIDVLTAIVVDATRVDARDIAAQDPVAFCKAADWHGVLPLIADGLLNRQDVDEELRTRLQQGARLNAAVDLRREAELRHLLSHFADAGVRPLLMKGAHLAYSCYPRSDLRPRVDSDLLVGVDARQAAHAVLTRAGYEQTIQVEGQFVSHQAQYVLRRGNQRVHLVDLHWRMSNPVLFADVLAFDVLARDAVPLPRLSPEAWGLSDVHALLLACVHRVAHHADSACLMWLYDIHLVASRLTLDGWRAFAGLAEARGVAAVCRHSLAVAGERFPISGMDRLPVMVAAGGAERTAIYLDRPRPVQRAIADLRSLPSWGQRLQLVREHLFPSTGYMRAVYAPSSSAPLPVLYFRRAVFGVVKWLGFQ
jgi:hypothetical protein